MRRRTRRSSSIPVLNRGGSRLGGGGAKEEGGESKKALVADGRKAASNVVQLRDRFTEISPQLRCKTERTVSDRAARDKACAMKKEKISRRTCLEN
jgi:hypothetical protein